MPKCLGILCGIWFGVCELNFVFYESPNWSYPPFALQPQCSLSNRTHENEQTFCAFGIWKWKIYSAKLLLFNSDIPLISK